MPSPRHRPKLHPAKTAWAVARRCAAVLASSSTSAAAPSLNGGTPSEPRPHRRARSIWAYACVTTSLHSSVPATRQRLTRPLRSRPAASSTACVPTGSSPISVCTGPRTWKAMAAFPAGALGTDSEKCDGEAARRPSNISSRWNRTEYGAPPWVSPTMIPASGPPKVCGDNPASATASPMAARANFVAPLTRRNARPPSRSSSRANSGTLPVPSDLGSSGKVPTTAARPNAPGPIDPDAGDDDAVRHESAPTARKTRTALAPPNPKELESGHAQLFRPCRRPNDPQVALGIAASGSSHLEEASASPRASTVRIPSTAPAPPKQMPDHGLRRAHGNPAGPRSQRGHEGGRLRRVVERRPGAMGVHVIHILGGDPGVPEGLAHRRAPHASPRVPGASCETRRWTRRSRRSPRGSAPPRHRAVPGFEEEDPGAFADRKPAPMAIERPAQLGRQRLERVETRERELAQRIVAPAERQVAPDRCAPARKA